jgi:hypothetical protein
VILLAGAPPAGMKRASTMKSSPMKYFSGTLTKIGSSHENPTATNPRIFASIGAKLVLVCGDSSGDRVLRRNRNHVRVYHPTRRAEQE